MAKVYAWPPVCPSARSLRISAPVSSERSILTGRRYASSRGPARYIVGLSAISHSCGGMVAGYMEALERYLDGGLNLVRLSLWSSTVSRNLQWFPSGVVATPVTSGDIPAFTLTGVPPRFELLRPEETFTVDGVVYRAGNLVVGSDSNTATVYVAGGVGTGGALTIGGAESRVFSVDTFPNPSETTSVIWQYDWTMTEIFESEVSDGFEEINPWV